jgi:hypothetical protein
MPGAGANDPGPPSGGVPDAGANSHGTPTDAGAVAGAPDAPVDGASPPCQTSTAPPARTATVTLLVGGPYQKHGKEMPYGHVAVRVLDGDSDKTYDFGRYGKTWGIGDSKGEGMLRIWTDFGKYITGENSTGRTTKGYSFQVTPEDAKKVNQFFADKVSGILPNQDRGYMKQYRLATDYDALGPNCATLSLDGARVAIPSIDASQSAFNKGRGLSFTEKTAATVAGWPDHIFMPQDLGAMLSNMTGDNKPISTATYGGN